MNIFLQQSSQLKGKCEQQQQSSRKKNKNNNKSVVELFGSQPVPGLQIS